MLTPQEAQARRERIATQVIAGLAARFPVTFNKPETAAAMALQWTDALIVELDKAR